MDIILSQLIDLYEHWYATCDLGRDDLELMLKHMRLLKEPGEIRPNLQPVVEKWISAESDLPSTDTHAPLVEIVKQNVKHLDWLTLPPDYAGAELSENFAFATIAGPRERHDRPTLYETDQFSCGFSIQSPGIFYAPHYHKSREFYTVLSGASRWQHGSKPPEIQQPGAYIYHESDLPHAMETLDAPLLTAWAWVGDLSSVIHVPSMDWL